MRIKWDKIFEAVNPESDRIKILKSESLLLPRHNMCGQANESNYRFFLSLHVYMRIFNKYTNGYILSILSELKLCILNPVNAHTHTHTPL